MSENSYEPDAVGASSPTPRKRRQRSSVTAEEILEAAERLAENGFDALTMRAVSTEIGASPMALYRYFANKDVLVDALLDRVLGRIELPPATDDWLADLDAFARAHRQVLARYPWAIVPLFTHSNPGINATVIGERAFSILARGGLTGTQSVATFCGILALNYGWSAFSSARDDLPDADPAATLGAALAALPPHLFPATIAVADELSHYGSDRHYDIALGQLLGGIAATPDAA